MNWVTYCFTSCNIAQDTQARKLGLGNSVGIIRHSVTVCYEATVSGYDNQYVTGIFLRFYNVF